MENTRRRDTPVELEIRRILHGRGLRYRVDCPVAGVTRARPDLVFPTEKVAVFVDGCFWHSCPVHGSQPVANADWWRAKLAANVERDRRHDRELRDAGWVVLRFWEHDDPTKAADEIEATVRRRRRAASRRQQTS